MAGGTSAVGSGRAGAPGTGARFPGSDGADGDQRGDLDPAADAGQPGRLHLGLLPGPPQPGSGRGHQGRVNELVSFMARLFAWALPSLEFFNAGPAISTGCRDSLGGLRNSCVGYCMLYSGAASCSRSCCSRIATWPYRCKAGHEVRGSHACKPTPIVVHVSS